MPIELYTLAKDVLHSVGAVRGVHTVFTSIVYTALVIAIIAMLFVLTMYPCVHNSPTWKIFKGFVYILGSVMVILTIHDSFLKSTNAMNTDAQQMNTFVRGVNGGATKNVHRTGHVHVDASSKEEYNDADEDVFISVDEDDNKPMTTTEMLDAMK